MDARTLTQAELPDFFQAVRLGFLQPPFPADVLERRIEVETEPSRFRATFEGATMTGTLRSFASEVSIPGGVLPASAVTGVTVRPTHRRRGTLRTLMGRELGDAAGRGEPVAVLIASEWPIYGRYGFGPATEHTTLEIDSTSTRFLVESTGTVELVDPAGAREEVTSLYAAHLRRTPGEVQRQNHRWAWDLGIEERPGEKRWDGYLALHRDTSGTVDGFLRYRAEETWEDRIATGTLHVDDLVTASDEAYVALWRFLCDIDTARTVKAEDRSVDELLPWVLADARAIRERGRSDLLWLRVLDVPGAFGSRTLASAGSVVMEVLDEAGHAQGRYHLEGGPDGATCLPTTRSAEVTLPVSSLSTAFLGGTRVSMLARAGQVEAARPAAVAALDAMLASPVTPWCSTWF